MHGWIHICLEELVMKKHGEETWKEIISSPDVSIPAGGWEMLEPYSDEVTFGIFGATCSVLKTELNPLLEAFGSFFLSFTAERGYSDMLNCQGATLREWLGNVNDLHENMKNSVASTFVFPLIFTEDDLDGGSESSAFILHYQSPRGGVLAPVVVGVVRAAADSYFHETVELELQASQGVDGSKFTSWRVLRTAGPVLAGNTGKAECGEMESLDLSPKKTRDFPARCLADEHSAEFQQIERRPKSPKKAKDFPARCPFSGATTPPSTSVPPRNGPACSDSSSTKSTDSSVPASSSHDGAPAATQNDVGMSVEMLNEVFPFHLKFNRDFVIVSVGPQLQKRVP